MKQCRLESFSPLHTQPALTSHLICRRSCCVSNTCILLQLVGLIDVDGLGMSCDNEGVRVF